MNKQQNSGKVYSCICLTFCISMYQCINVGFRLQNCGDTGLPIKHVIKHAGCAETLVLKAQSLESHNLDKISLTGWLLLAIPKHFTLGLQMMTKRN